MRWCADLKRAILWRMDELPDRPVGLWPALARACSGLERNLRPAPGPDLKKLSGVVALAMILAIPMEPAAQSRRADPNPDATIEIEEVRVGVLVLGGTFGGGRLHFGGRDHAFTVNGLEFGSVGVSSLSARGEVFGLARLQDFAGRYTQEAAPQPPGGESGPEQLRLRNAAGVVIRLRSERDGAVLRVTDAGLNIQFRQ
jgi:hypothetical protein